MSDAPFIELRGIYKAYEHNQVLKGLDLHVDRGECFTLLGGSGTGKSVSLRHIIGLTRADAGEVLIDGRDVTDLREADWVPIRTRIAFVFQGAALFDSLSVYENVAYPLREHRPWPEERIAARVAECLDAVGLVGVENQMPAELSGGMRKRVGVARSIALEPEAILYDEPTTGLDPANARRIGELIRHLQRSLNVTSLVVTHDLELCFLVSDRVALLSEGQIVAQGSVDEIRRSTHPEVRDFLAGRGAPSAAPGDVESEPEASNGP